MPNRLIAMRGLPGSGKTTIARCYQHNYTGSTYVRVNRDDLRKSLFDEEGILAFEKEEMITKVQRSMAEAALAAGNNVIVDDTNLRNKYLRAWNEFALDHGADFRVFTVDTPIGECVERDSVRERSVGSGVIHDLAKRFMLHGKFPEYEYIDRQPVPAYEPKPDTPYAVIVDIDGTMAHNDGHRDWYDLSKVLDDKVHEHIRDLVYREILAGHYVIFLSGREGTDQCRADTFAWLQRELPKGYDNRWRLLMRHAGDRREDSVIKREIFDQEIRDNYNVQYVLDDRNQVVKMWRSLGIPCLQVAEGNF